MKASSTTSLATPKPSRIKRLLLALAILVTAVAAIGGTVALLYSNSTHNYAADVAKPLEDGLVANGAVKKTSGGDPGRGLDNTTPRYSATYELSVSKGDAIMLVNKVAKANGFKLTHASPSNRGYLGAVADKYIDNWYFDISSKDADYPGLTEGTVKLGIEVTDKDDNGNPQPTTVRIDVRLPSTR